MNAPSPDHQSTVVPGICEAIHEKTSSNAPQHPSSADFTNQFPWRLHQMLEAVENEGNASTISWMPGHPQDTFKVHKKEEFMEQVMPRFFNQTKFKSFLRQLNLWGFERILESGPRRGGYRHSLFIKNRPNLCNQMKRTKIKGAKHGESGESQQQLARMVVQQHELTSHVIDAAGRGQLAKTADETSFDTIEYEKIPHNMPVAADLSRMFAEAMEFPQNHSPSNARSCDKSYHIDENYDRVCNYSVT